MEIVGSLGGDNFQTFWVPLNSTSTVYVGSVVKSTADGVDIIATASGVGDTTAKAVICGLVKGTSDNVKTYDSTTHSNKIAGVITQAAQVARDNRFIEGDNAPKGDPQAFAEIIPITANTLLRARLYNATMGVAPTVQTVTTGSTDGLGYTANATDVAGVADLCTAFCRVGANAGLYRITDDSSATVITNDRAFPQDIAVGDKFLRVPLRPIGSSYVQTDSLGMFFNVAAAPATDYWIINVWRLNLSVAGNEYVDFTFAPCHFDLVRA